MLNKMAVLTNKELPSNFLGSSLLRFNDFESLLKGVDMNSTEVVIDMRFLTKEDKVILDKIKMGTGFDKFTLVYPNNPSLSLGVHYNQNTKKVWRRTQFLLGESSYNYPTKLDLVHHKSLFTQEEALKFTFFCGIFEREGQMFYLSYNPKKYGDDIVSSADMIIGTHKDIVMSLINNEIRTVTKDEKIELGFVFSPNMETLEDNGVNTSCNASNEHDYEMLFNGNHVNCDTQYTQPVISTNPLD